MDEGNVRRWAHIDQILGASSARYFGAGFRQVNHGIHDIQVDIGASTASAAIDVQYPKEWSKKRSRQLEPHLSTLDTMTVAAGLTEIYLRHAYSLADGEVARCWIRRAVMRASAAPTTGLTRVPASVTLRRSEPSEASLCGHLSHFTCMIGSMGIDLVLDHPSGTQGSGVVPYERLEDVLGASQHRHYAGIYKSTGIDLTNVVTHSIEHAVATMTLAPVHERADVSGLSASYEPFVSMMHALVAAAQMSQVLLYQYDQISRESSNNMWLRKLSMEMQRATPIEGPFEIKTSITKTTVLPMKATRWRSANFVTSFPGIQMEYNLAHELTPVGVPAPLASATVTEETAP